VNHLRFLKYVDEIARAGSIRQAAERLHVAPSAVNRRLQDIEDELDTPIFERLPRGMRLTAAGELFIRYVRTRNAQLEQVRSQIEELKGLRRGTVRLVVSQAVAAAFLPRAIASFRKSHQQVAFEVHVGDHVNALSTLRAFESDLAIVFNLAAEPDVERIAVVEQKLVALMHRSHPLATRKAGLRLRDCVEYPLALPNRDTGGRQLLERFLLKSSIKMQPLIESNSFEFLRNCVYHGHAITFQVAIGAVRDGSALVAREIEDRGFPRGQLVLARLTGRQLPVIAHAFAAHVEHTLAADTQLAK
jgi:DNA-binding transcriptional LysR family regulator